MITVPISNESITLSSPPILSSWTTRSPTDRSEQLCLRFFSRAEAAEVLALVKESGLALTGEAPRLQARRLLARLDLGTVRRLLALRQAQTGEKGFAALASAAAALEQEQACCRVGQLAVNGRDLLALGVRPGPAVGRLLSAALEQVVEEKLPNDRAALLGWLRTQQIP